MAQKSGLTAARLRELLSYDEKTGVFTWRVSRGRSRAGAICGNREASGYLRITVDGVLYMAHRLAFLWMNGEMPEQFVDHRDGARANNAWANLREASMHDNMQNTAPRASNKSGFVGVCWISRDRKWRATINKDGRQFNLGDFSKIDDAKRAYLKAKAELHTFQPVPRDAAHMRF